MSDIIPIIGLGVSIAGLACALMAFIYVKWFAVKKIEDAIESISVQIPMGDAERIGIEPMKDVIIQQTQTQDSVRTESSHFVSYFGLCFQPEGNKMIDMKNPNSKMSHGDDRKIPFKSIDIFQQRSDERTQTPPTDEEQSDPSTSNHSDYNDDSNDAGISIGSKDDGNSIDNEDDFSFKSDDSKRNKRQPKFNDKDDNDDDEDGDSFGPLQEYYKTDYDEDIDMEYSINSDSIVSDHKQHKHKPLTSRDDGIPFSSNINDAVRFMDRVSDACDDGTHNNRSIPKRRTVSFDDSEPTIIESENPSYFSSDDEQENDDSHDDDSSFGNEPSIEKLIVVKNIESSLSIPDLEESGTGSDSDDWELSSSSASSEGKQLDIMVDVSTVNININTKQQQLTEDNNNIINNISSESETSLSLSVCPFCHEEYDKEEGIRFSYDERCIHLMCMDCCEEGKFAQCNGECPECSTGQTLPKRPPRVPLGQQPQVIMSI